MPANLIVISEQLEDFEFGENVAKAGGFVFKPMMVNDDISTFLIENSQSMILWDAENPTQSSIVGETFKKLSYPATKVFAITSKSMNAYPHLSKYPVFGHHLLRRYGEPAPEIYGRLIAASLIPVPFGLARYFPPGTACQKITLARSSQKGAAVEAMQRYLEKAGMISRLAALAAQATDELLMNAIFDAPVDSGGEPVRRVMDRSSDFELLNKDQVQLEVASAGGYVGLCVGDQFGSLKKNVLMKFLMQDYESKSYSVWRHDPGAGLGLHAASQAGLSLLFICQPGIRTEVMLFLAKSSNYREFRAGFRFTSILAG